MNHFPNGSIVTVVNEKDTMFGHQGEVVSSSFDDEVDGVLYVYVKFHVAVVGQRNDLVQSGDYYVGIRHPKGPGTFAYQDRSPEMSSIRLDGGYTEGNKKKIGILSEAVA